MKPSILVLSAALAAGALSGSAQTLFTPAGAVGTSANGNVGVGTNSPDEKLSVAGNLSIGGGYLAFRNSVGGTAYGLLALQGGDLSFKVYGTGGWRDALLIRGDTGNVGVGTLTPGAKLEIIGGSQAFGLIVEGDGIYANARIALRRANDPGATGNIDWIGNTNSVGARIGVNDDFAGAMQFKLGGGTAADTKLIITSAGSVGIGTTTPTHKLTVNGAVRAKEVIVDTGWSDYVFADDYRLTPLGEVERHIKTEKHLPGIPSAAEVAKEGISVGEMQAKLLAKVEELTLYVVELKKENDALRARIAAVENRKPTP